jgi:thioredoxin
MGKLTFAVLIFAIAATGAPLTLTRASSYDQLIFTSPKNALAPLSGRSRLAALAAPVGEVSDANFETEVLKAAGPVVVNFWAEWCGPCRMTTPALDEISSAMGGEIKIVKVDVDKSMQTASKYGIMSIPTLMIFRGDAVISSQIGAAPKEKLQQWINSNLQSLGKQGNAALDGGDANRAGSCGGIESDCNGAREMTQNSRTAYVHQQAELIRSDILGIASDIAHARPLFDQDRGSFHDLLAASSASRNLSGTMLIDKDRNILEAVHVGIPPKFKTPETDFLSKIGENEPEIAVFPDTNYIAAVIRLRTFDSTFLYVTRLLDPRVLAPIKPTDAGITAGSAN